MMDFFRYDFDYSWPWTYGHLIAAVVFGGLAAAAYWLQWTRLTIAAGVLAIWGLSGAYIIHGPLRFSRPVAMPTERFLPSGSGRVLDAGAGSGRSTVMVLLSRPAAKVVALDRFTGYYGIADNTPDRLRANARAAGAEDRVEVKVGDMREMPFEDASFDGVVSVAAIDHLNREGVERTLAEVTRVLRPEGQFLLMVVNPDIWTKVAMPFLHGHGYFGGRAYPERWRSQLSAAGLDVVEEGTQPASLFFLTQKHGPAEAGRYGIQHGPAEAGRYGIQHSPAKAGHYGIQGSAKTYTAPPSGTSGY